MAKPLWDGCGRVVSLAVQLSDIARDVTDYVFAPDTLTVKFHDDRPANVFKIMKYTYTDDSVRINWLNGADELVMVFAEFSGNKTAMAQQENGDKLRRAFHRC